MKTILLFAGILFHTAIVWAEPGLRDADSSTTGLSDLEKLVSEALDDNQEISAATHQMRLMDAHASQVGALDDPELTFMREAMPWFRYGDAQMQRFELMQIIPFPSKLSARNAVARFGGEHAHHDHLEKMNDVVARLKSGYAELWYTQHAITLQVESQSLLLRVLEIAKTRYSVGISSQQDLLKTQIELEKLQNAVEILRQQETATSAMLTALLNRDTPNTIGTAILPDTVVFNAYPDTLIALALQFRPMLLHDSLGVEESRAMVVSAQREYLPDMKIGFQYVTEPVSGMRGWSVIAGVSIPFAPWTLGKAAARVEEADAAVERATANYHASRDMIVATVREMYFRTVSFQRQLRSYRRSIVPLAHEALDASLAGYQHGTTDFPMLIDSFRTLLELRMESFMARMQFEQSIAELERAVGIDGIAQMN